MSAIAASLVVAFALASFVQGFVLPTLSAPRKSTLVISRIGVALDSSEHQNNGFGSNETDTTTSIWNSVQMKKRIMQQPFFRITQEEQMAQSIKIEQQRQEMKRLQQEITDLQNELWALKAEGGQDLWKQKYSELQKTQKVIQQQHLNAMEARTLRLEALENQLQELTQEYDASQNELQASVREQKRLEKLLVEKDKQHQEEVTLLSTLQEQTLKKTIENERSKAAKELEKLKQEFLQQLEQLQETSRVELGIAETEFEFALREMKQEREAEQEKHQKAVSDWALVLDNSNRRIENLEEMLRSTNDKLDETMAAYVSARQELESTQSTLDVTVEQLDETSTLLMQATEEIELLTTALKTTAQKLDDTELAVRILEGEKKSLRRLIFSSFQLLKDRIKALPKRLLQKWRRRRSGTLNSEIQQLSRPPRTFPSLRPAYQKLERAEERLRRSNLSSMDVIGDQNNNNNNAMFFADRDSSRRRRGKQP
jgi:chromosome segregation ATPase